MGMENKVKMTSNNRITDSIQGGSQKILEL